MHIPTEFDVCYFCAAQVLRESKALMRNSSRSSLEQTNERECEALKRIWGSSQGTDAILQHLHRSKELY